ncbi:MAG: OsmC family protein [Acidimicrobiales bacterium]
MTIRAGLSSNAAGHHALIANGVAEALVNSGSAREAGEAGFGPHELLEAALAGCAAITLRIAAEKYGLALHEAAVTVTLERGDDDAVFTCEVELTGELSAADRRRLVATVARCPVAKTLVKQVKVIAR